MWYVRGAKQKQRKKELFVVVSIQYVGLWVKSNFCLKKHLMFRRSGPCKVDGRYDIFIEIFPRLLPYRRSRELDAILCRTSDSRGFLIGLLVVHGVLLVLASVRFLFKLKPLTRPSFMCLSLLLGQGGVQTFLLLCVRTVVLRLFHRKTEVTHTYSIGYQVPYFFNFTWVVVTRFLGPTKLF